MLPRRCAVAVAGLLALAPALVACGGDTGVAVGDVVPARDDAQFSGAGNESVVALPIGSLEITLGKPTDKLSADDTRQAEAIDAPDGGTFVPITWQYDASSFGRYADFIDTEATPDVDLIADGATYRIPPPDDSGTGSTSFYVVVGGPGKDPSLKIDFDGVTQTVDLTTGDRDAGAAEALYDLPSPRTKRTDCTGAIEYGRKLVGSSTFTCSVTRPVRLPYAGDAWAEDGQGWLAVTVRTTLGRWNEVAKDLKSGGVYYATGVVGSFRLGDIEAAQAYQDNGETTCPSTTSGSCTTEFHVIFPVGDKAPKKLRVEQDYTLLLTSAWGTGTDTEQNLDLPVTATTTLK
ncbi:hypothetical protein ABFU82_15845 [Nocardioides sp. WV_118_6]